MKKDIKVETLKFDTPLKAEHRRQSKIKADKECRHLKGLEIVNLVVDDGIETYTGCPLCGKLLLPDEVKEVEKTLEKFKNLSK